MNPNKIVIVTDKKYVFEPVLRYRGKGCQKFIPFLHPKQSLAEIFVAIKKIPLDQTEAVLVHAGISGYNLLVNALLEEGYPTFLITNAGDIVAYEKHTGIPTYSEEDIIDRMLSVWKDYK